MDRPRRTQRFLRHAARWPVTAAVLISPWCFGSADPWAYLLMGQLAAIGTALWLFSLVSSRDPVWRVRGLTAALLALLAVTAVQVLPLPPSVAGLLNPTVAAARQAGLRTLAETGLDESVDGAPAPYGGHALSASPAATQRGLGLLIAYVGVFLVMANTCRRWRHIKQVATLLVLSGFLMALIAIVHRFSGSREIFWFHTPRHGGNVFGPFSNRNHFAAHLNMLFGLSLGLFLAASRIGQELAPGSWRERLAWLSTKRASRIALSAFAAVLLGGAACLSLSRGAMAGLALSLGLLALAAGFAFREDRHVRITVGAVFLLVAAGVIWLGWRDIVARLGSLAAVAADPFGDFRYVVTADTLNIFGACPLWGCGFGAFRHVFPMFQQPGLQWRWLHAHNEWAQLLAEGGMVGAFVFLLIVALWARTLVRRLRGGRREAVLFVFGTAVGIVALGLHSVVDYSLRKPANAFLLAAVAGLCVAAAHLPGRDHDTVAGEQPLDPAPDNRARKCKRLALHAGVLVLLVAMVVRGIAQHRELRGELGFARFVHLLGAAEKAGHPDALRQVVAGAADEAEIVLQRVHWDPDARRDIAVLLFPWASESKLPRPLRARLTGICARAAHGAVRQSPTDYLAWLWLARVHAAGGFWDAADRYLVRARDLVAANQRVRLSGGPGR